MCEKVKILAQLDEKNALQKLKEGEVEKECVVMMILRRVVQSTYIPKRLQLVALNSCSHCLPPLCKVLDSNAPLLHSLEPLQRSVI